MSDNFIDTNDPNWASKLAEMYRTKTSFTFKDSAGIGVNLADKNLLDILLTAGLSTKEVIAVLGALGVSSFGCWMIRVAVSDPEPVSKSVLATLGTALIAFGFGSAYKVLTGEPPASIEFSKGTFKVGWN